MENKYYNFFYRLWNLILAYFYFILVNLPLLLSQFLLKFNSPVLMIMITSALSITLLPSYSSSIRMIVENQLSPKKYLYYMKENWSPGHLISILLIFLFLITRLNIRYFSNRFVALSFVFDILGWIVLLFFFNIAIINNKFRFEFPEYFVLSILYFKDFLKSSIIILILFVSGISFLSLKYNFLLMFIFPIHAALTREPLDKIEKNHTS